MSDIQTLNNKYGKYINDIIIKEINNYMQKNNLTDNQFAEKIGVSRSTVTSWRIGRQRPSEKTLDNLSKVLRQI